MEVASLRTESPFPSASPVLPGRRAKKKVTTRADLVRAGRALFSDEGLYASRVEDLAKRAGIAKGTFYLYFDRKEDLVLAVVSEGFDRLGRLVDAAAKDAHTLEDLSSRIVEAHCRFFAENPDLLRVFHQMRGMLKFRRQEWRPLRRVLAAHLEHLGACLGRLEGAERLPAARRAELAAWLFGAISGILSVRAAANPKSGIPACPARLAAVFAGFARAYAVGGRGRNAQGAGRSPTTHR